MRYVEWAFPIISFFVESKVAAKILPRPMAYAVHQFMLRLFDLAVLRPPERSYCGVDRLPGLVLCPRSIVADETLGGSEVPVRLGSIPPDRRRHVGLTEVRTISSISIFNRCVGGIYRNALRFRIRFSPFRLPLQFPAPADVA
jgi:hypothetical protein